MEKTAKEAFFDELYKLDEDDSGEEDASNASIVLSRSKLVVQKPRIGPRMEQDKVIHPLRSDQPLARTVSAPLPHQESTPDNLLRPHDAITYTSTDAPFIQGFHISNAPSITKSVDSTKTKSMPKATGKRKRGQSLEQKPEYQQVFRGLSFFFIPNDKVAPARKARIDKAMEYGALWVREWGESVSHIIADNYLCYQDITKFLKIPSLPPNVILVNEVYPSDCIRYGFVVNPYQQFYRVSGHETAIDQPPPKAIISSNTSLELKPARSKGISRHDSTPLQADESDPIPSNLTSNDAIKDLDNVPRRNTDDQSEYSQSALDDAIDEAKAIQDLPLDLDEDESSKDARNESNEDSSENERRSKSRSNKDSFSKPWQQGFSCMSRHDGKGGSQNPNARTIDILQQMVDHYERHQDHWRLTAYRKAIGALRKQSIKVTTAKQALAIPSIGGRLADKIEEIVWTNRLRRLDNANKEPIDEIFQLFTTIYSVGMKQATKWIDQGHRTIEDLLEKVPLTTNQRIGIEHLHHFQARIPRQEMDRHDRYVRDTCNKIDSSIQFTIGGSYRRGAADSGDVDFIVTKPDCSIEVLRSIILNTIIPQLFKNGYLKVGLATTDKEDGSKWHGAAALPGETVWRRIDFLLVPWEELGAALIYFTGNDIFNRSMRLLASKKGMRLNQRGLWKDVIRGPNRQRVTQGTLVESRDERKIFEVLGVPWRPPHHSEYSSSAPFQPVPIVILPNVPYVVLSYFPIVTERTKY